MEDNVNYYNAALHLVEASSWLRSIDENLAEFLLDKAEELTRRLIVIDEDEKEEIEKYEQLLK